MIQCFDRAVVYRAAALCGIQLRKKQLEYMASVWEHLVHSDTASKTKFAVLEAETGLGKTLGYLVPLLVYQIQTGRRVMVATNTIALQRQIVKQDYHKALGIARQIVGSPYRMPNAVSFFGRANFVNLQAIKSHLIQADKAAAPVLCDLLEWSLAAISRGGGLIDDWLEHHALPAGYERDDFVLRRWDSKTANPNYWRQLENARMADIVITNHAVLALHARYDLLSGDGGDELADLANQRQFGAVLVDEAHLLEDILASSMECRHALQRILALAKQARQSGIGVGALIKQIAEAERLSLRFHETAGRETLVVHTKEHADLIRAVTAMFTRLRKTWPKVKTAGNVRLMQGWMDVIGDLNVWINLHYDEYRIVGAPIIYRTEVNRWPGIGVVSLKPGLMLRRLWHAKHDNGLRSVILTSGTMSDVAADLAIDDNRICCKPSTFALAHHGTLTHFSRMDDRVPGPFIRNHQPADEDDLIELDDRWLDALAEMCRHAQKTHGPYGLVLTTSYVAAHALFERVDDDSFLLHRQGEKLRPSLTQMQERRIALITPAGWEGVDIPGLDFLVLAQLPIPPVSQGRIHAWSRFYQQQGLDPVTAMERSIRIEHKRNLGQAVRRFAQGFGRAFRVKDDRVAVYIGDPRFKNRALFHRALPMRFRHHIAGMQVFLPAAIGRQPEEETFDPTLAL